MNIIELLGRTDSLSPSEQVEVDRRLASAYAIDESAAKNGSVERIADKIEALFSLTAAEEEEEEKAVVVHKAVPPESKSNL